MKSVLIMLGFYNYQMVELCKCRNKLCYQYYVIDRIVFHQINAKNQFASRVIASLIDASLTGASLIGALHQPIIKIKYL